jgi:uncharacterized damage-inducible protein DinB
MDRTDIADLYDYDAWAAKRILEAAAALSPEQYAQDLGASFGGLRGALVHSYAAQRLWLDRWKGNSPKALLGEAQIPTLDALRERWETYRVEFEDFIRFMNDDNMKEKFSYVDFQGKFQEMPLHLQMLHVILHAAHHRGQTLSILRQLGAQPPNTDFMTFLKEKQGT